MAELEDSAGAHIACGRAYSSLANSSSVRALSDFQCREICIASPLSATLVTSFCSVGSGSEIKRRDGRAGGMPGCSHLACNRTTISLDSPLLAPKVPQMSSKRLSNCPPLSEDLVRKFNDVVHRVLLINFSRSLKTVIRTSMRVLHQVSMQVLPGYESSPPIGAWQRHFILGGARAAGQLRSMPVPVSSACLCRIVSCPG